MTGYEFPVPSVMTLKSHPKVQPIRKKRLWQPELGSCFLDAEIVKFKVWGPRIKKIEVKMVGGTDSLFLLEKDGEGYHSGIVEGLAPGMRYFYRLDGKKDRPDPCSRFQPEGVHGPSCLIDPDTFQWHDSRWKGIPLSDLIFYELHTGTFTPEGTFDAVIGKLPYLKKLGITCVEIMPVAQFPGKRNWGYDGVGLFAVQNSYGGPEGLKKLVNACHRMGLAVCLDVVYNHFGPEGNYLHDYGPYFTHKYHTPWGDAVNYDDAESDHVRRFIIENALYWVTEYHIDALRLDAIHAIYDFSAKHILEELNDRVEEQARKLGRVVHVVAESDLNDSKIIRPKKQSGYGLAAQWSDDFHHAVHAFLTHEHKGYYEDFGRLRDIEKAFKEGFVYDGQYAAFRKRRHGNPVKDLPPEKLVVCVQNHDQIGNRAFGDRLTALLPFEDQKLAAVILLLSPFTPLLFMGEEYGEKSPFQYFIDHEDADLVRAVQEGRKKEFQSFGWSEIPDPYAVKTFHNSTLRWESKTLPGRQYLDLYQGLIKLRKTVGCAGKRPKVWCDEEKNLLAWRYDYKKSFALGILISFAKTPQTFKLPFGAKHFKEILSTEDARYGGSRKKSSCVHSAEIEIPPACAVIGKF